MNSPRSADRILADASGGLRMKPGVTDQHIRELRNEAATAGDHDQVALCTRALDGDTEARAACIRVIREARLQNERAHS